MGSTIETITAMSAQRLARAIAAGELRALDVVNAHIARIQAVNGALNAVVVTRFEAARQEAAAIDERRARGEMLPPLAGVPITVKECLDLNGTPSTFGLPARAQHRADSDEVHVARLRAAGAIVLGKTNVSQCLIYTEADNPLYGRTQNPWNLDRTSGGSSGGEAAIIAAGGSPLGLGTDIGGSVRVPAHFCGVASLKPTSGRLDDLGRFSVPVGQRAIPSQVGVFARHVEDIALGLDIVNGGREPADPALHRLGDWQGVELRGLRVAYYTDDGTFAASPALRRAVEEAAAMLRQLGAEVTAWQPPAVPEAMSLYGRILTADRLAGMKQILSGSTRTPQVSQLILGAKIPPWAAGVLRRLLHALGQHTLASNLESVGPDTTAHYWQALEAQLEYQQQFARAMDRAPGGPFDVILTPPSSLPAFTHGATRDLFTAGGYSALYNLLGYPAGIVPFTRVRPDEESSRTPGLDFMQKLAQTIEHGSAGLPVGVQVVARPWQEHRALAVMAALEHGTSQQADFPRTPIMTTGAMQAAG